MSKFDAVDHYFSGQGVVLIGVRGTDGKPLALFPVGNVPALKLSLAVSTIEHKESHTGQRGIDKRLTTETKCTISLVMENFIGSNLALALRGTTSTIAGGTATDEKVNGFKGGVSPLAHISAAVTKVTTDSGTPVTLTAYPGTAGKWDYKVNNEAGSIMLNPELTTWDKLIAGHFTLEVAKLLVTYTFAAQEVIDALTTAASEVWMRFEGLNTAEDNSPVVVEIFKFSADPLKELSLIADTIQQFNMDGSVLVDVLQATGSQFFKVTKLKPV